MSALISGGGRMFMRRFIDFETDETGFGNDELAVAAAFGDTDQTPAEPEAPTGGEETRAGVDDAPTVEASGWAGPSQDEWQHVMHTVGALGQILQPPQQQQYEQPEVPDPYTDPAGYAAYIQQGIMQAIQPVVAPVQEQQAQQLVNGWHEKLGVPEPDREYLNRQALAHMGVDQYGRPINGEQALRMALDETRARDERVGKAAVEAYKAELQRAVSGRDEAARQGPAAAGSATEVVSHPKGADELDVGRRFVERHRLGAVG